MTDAPDDKPENTRIENKRNSWELGENRIGSYSAYQEEELGRWQSPMRRVLTSYINCWWRKEPFEHWNCLQINANFRYKWRLHLWWMKGQDFPRNCGMCPENPIYKGLCQSSQPSKKVVSSGSKKKGNKKEKEYKMAATGLIFRIKKVSSGDGWIRAVWNKIKNENIICKPHLLLLNLCFKLKFN